MFKFSFKWLKDYCSSEITLDEIFNILNLQGFEFQGKEELPEDIVTTIEVKANRPDMLYHRGIAREINAYKNNPFSEVAKFKIGIDNENFPIRININKDVCQRYSSIIIKNINNKVQTPEYICSRLSALGINCVNPVVDIANYVMLDLGQPLHSYDVSKIKGSKLSVEVLYKNMKVTTLAGVEEELRSGDIVICDSSEPLCLAGIIGSDTAAVTSETKEILLEAAVFDAIKVRMTSRALKVSTPSSFRFERGVNVESTLDILGYCAKMITEICGGEILPKGFDYYPDKNKTNNLSLSVKNTNRLLGTSLNSSEIIKYLEKYNFKCNNLSEDMINVVIPSYRLDVLKEVDLIEEVARIHGYDNIPISMPKLVASYHKNDLWSNMDRIRNILVGMNFLEVINYSFIPSNTMSVLGIKEGSPLYSDLQLQNPISNAYALMRPTLVYSLVNCLSYNYSIKNTDLAIFELGRTYFRDSHSLTKCVEHDMCGFIFSGVRVSKGWGCDKELKYNFYDIISYLEVLMDNFGVEFELKQYDYPFCEKSTSCQILVSGEPIGFIGEINKKRFDLIKNVKLIKDRIFYCEFNIAKINFKSKRLKFESKYPPVNRQYNFLYSKNILASEIIDAIKSTSELVIKVVPKDIYTDKNMNPNFHSVLYEVDYCSKHSTLTLEEIEKIERGFISLLKNKFDVNLKN